MKRISTDDARKLARAITRIPALMQRERRLRLFDGHGGGEAAGLCVLFALLVERLKHSGKSLSFFGIRIDVV